MVRAVVDSGPTQAAAARRFNTTSKTLPSGRQLPRRSSAINAIATGGYGFRGVTISMGAMMDVMDKGASRGRHDSRVHLLCDCRSAAGQSVSDHWGSSVRSCGKVIFGVLPIRFFFGILQ